ncbi:MAG: lipoprotein signal peptidase [Paludibacteraceae bacterium]|nr:lipoprotein signal peptidase [Paludibacteraceae bacterium]
MNKKAQTWLVAGIILLVLLIDQCLKFYVKLNFALGEAHAVFPWFQICFVENDGMAFGIEWFDKMFLTLFRIIAVGLFGWYIYMLINKQKTRTSYLVMVALITAGALGNIIDCLFYGLIFSESTPLTLATLMPEGGGYAPFFYGKVVDMLYFPLIHNSAGETLFFRPVFNFADSCITVAVIVVFLFFSKDLNNSLTKKNTD